MEENIHEQKKTNPHYGWISTNSYGACSIDGDLQYKIWLLSAQRLKGNTKEPIHESNNLVLITDQYG
jgi:hypothetical protein